MKKTVARGCTLVEDGIISRPRFIYSLSEQGTGTRMPACYTDTCVRPYTRVHAVLSIVFFQDKHSTCAFVNITAFLRVRFRRHKVQHLARIFFHDISRSRIRKLEARALTKFLASGYYPRRRNNSRTRDFPLFLETVVRSMQISQRYSRETIYFFFSFFGVIED